MHEKMELKTNTKGVLLTACWPPALAVLLMLVLCLILFSGVLALMITGIMLLVTAVTMALCIPSYLGTYVFLPATSIKGARLIARLGRANEYEVSGVSASEIIVKQGWLEKLANVCHIRVKGTSLYFRGVPEMEKVQEWVNANFPQRSQHEIRAEEKAKGGKKGKKAKK